MSKRIRYRAYETLGNSIIYNPISRPLPPWVYCNLHVLGEVVDKGLGGCVHSEQGAGVQGGGGADVQHSSTFPKLVLVDNDIKCKQ